MNAVVYGFVVSFFIYKELTLDDIPRVLLRTSQLTGIVLEVPIFSNARHGGDTTTNHWSALKLYWGALRMWRSLRQGS